MDLSKLSLGDKVMAGSGIALFIFSLFPWYGVDGFRNVGRSGWDYTFTGIVPVLLGLILVGYVVVTKVLDGVTLPELPVAYPLVVLGLGGLAALLVVLRLIIGDDVFGFDLERKFGMFLATLSALGLGGGAFLKFQEEGGELPTKKTDGGSTGTQPPTPF